jgi:aldehyde:ferredoxin oxidoreductase
MAYYGYAGKELYVDLTNRRVWDRPLDLDEATKFLGGMGMQLRLLYELLKPGTDPLSPENPLIIGAGPLVGTAAPGTPRVLATAKYPQTEAVGSGGGSMRFGFMLKLAGYDHIIITGRSSSPVYLKITNEEVEICDASYLWGKDLVETTKALWEEYGDCGVIAIGQAGENQVKISLAMVDNAASLGRGGLGGIMGSKNLKALVARGMGVVRIAQPERFNKVVEGLFERDRRYPHREDTVRYGIMLNWPNYKVQFGYYKNRSEIPDLKRAEKAFGFEAYKNLGKKAISCPSCFIADKEIVEVKEGKYKGLEWSTPSYVNAGILAFRLGLKDSGEAVRFADLTDRYGLDQLSFSELIDFLITLREEGLLSSEDVGGLPLRRDFDTAVAWAEKTALREGFGDIVADGWARVLEEMGHDLGRRAPITKGRDGIWDPRVSGLGTNEFAQLVYPRGPNAESGGTGLYTLNQSIDQVKRHGERMGMSQEQIKRAFNSPFKVNVGRLTVSSEHWLAIFNCLGICNRHVNNRFYHINTCSELYSAATGVELGPRELVKCAERVWNLFKLINVREGFFRKDDEPPDKWFEPIRTSEGKEMFMMDYYRTKVFSREDVDRWLDDYYDERGWGIKTGIPTRRKLLELGLGEMLPDLEETERKLFSA